MRMQFLTVLLIGFTLASAGVFVSEYQNFQRSNQAWPGLALPAGPTGIPTFSLAATQGALRRCATVLAPPLVNLRPAEQLRAFAKSCARLARRTTATMPTLGLAYYLAALVENFNANTAARDGLLARSARFAPSEGWLAERRFTLGMGLHLPDNAVENIQLMADTAILLTTQSGAELIADYYFRRPASRGFFADVASRAAQTNQKRLLNLLTKRRAGS